MALGHRGDPDKLIGGPQVQSETVRNLDLAAGDCRLAAHSRLSVLSPVTTSFRLGPRRVNVDVQVYVEVAHFCDRFQGKLFDVIGLCATMDDEPVLEDLDANAGNTTMRFLVNPAFKNACDRLEIFSRPVAAFHGVLLKGPTSTATDTRAFGLVPAASLRVEMGHLDPACTMPGRRDERGRSINRQHHGLRRPLRAWLNRGGCTPPTFVVV